MEAATFEGDLDRYKGITVDSQKEPCEQSSFINQLNDSLKKWSENKIRCVWFKVSIKDAEWVPILAKKGFNFHHSRDDFVMMYQWLPTDSSSNLPPACHTSVGVGGLVFNERNEILVVCEQHFEFPHWKLPGGYVERGEDMKDAALREVKEETGIDATYETMVTLRHTHNMMFGNSDIYVIVQLKATSESITRLESEIKECKWMNIEEFLNHPHVHEFNRSIVRQAIDLKKRGLKLDLQKSTLNFSKISKQMTTLALKDSH